MSEIKTNKTVRFEEDEVKLKSSSLQQQISQQLLFIELLKFKNSPANIINNESK
jgi:hypothetical protein